MRARLKVRPAAAEPFEVEVGNTATIGRGRDNTVCLAMSAHCSRQHAIIRCHNAFQYQIMDLGSRNGTFVNGRRVITPQVLTDGATIKITDNEITFEQIDDEADSGHYDVTIAAATDTSDASATVAIMVCDIRGFSTVSEQLPEDQLARTLGEWFRHAGNLVQESGGTIDKFIGDAILAYWIRDNDETREAQKALETGLKLLEKSTSMHWPEGLRKFEIAVALHHGPVTCGNIGLVAQRDATIIGDSVNTAFRIEGVMKPLGKQLVASRDFLDMVTHAPVEFADLGEHQLKGKNQLVRLMGYGEASKK